ncbi:transmembrane protein 234 homolog [Crassostrea virginica]
MSACWFILVAAMWGATNPFIKRGSRGIENIRENGKVRQFLMELKFLICNWKYIVPFVINQSGSVLYYLTLASAELSLAVPITNSLTFLFTILSGWCLGDKIRHWETYVGMLLVLAGVALCVSDKM